jgi:hypothetical protein
MTKHDPPPTERESSETRKKSEGVIYNFAGKPKGDPPPVVPPKNKPDQAPKRKD